MTALVMCYRDPSSIFGAATRPLRNEHGEIETFKTIEDARREADKLNARRMSTKVHYLAVPSIGEPPR